MLPLSVTTVEEREMKKLFLGIVIGAVAACLVMSNLGCATTAAPANHEMHQTGIDSHTSDY